VVEQDVVTLWRPTGPEELALVEASGWRRWPPRLPDQPIFYPVLNEDYAVRIARDWNVNASGVGYVTRFDVRRAFLDEFDVPQAGGETILEYWIPAERLEELNDSIVGTVEVMQTFRCARAGAGPSGERRRSVRRPAASRQEVEVLPPGGHGVDDQLVVVFQHEDDGLQQARVGVEAEAQLSRGWSVVERPHPERQSAAWTSSSGATPCLRAMRWTLTRRSARARPGSPRTGSCAASPRWRRVPRARRR
jgi:hypothetical protein